MTDAFAAPEDLVLPEGIDAPGDVQRVLDVATRALLSQVLVQAVYDVDTDGNPTDEAVIEVFRQACVAQAAWIIEVGDETGAASMMRGASISGGPSWTGAVPRISPVAADIIRAGVDSAGSPILQGAWQWT